MVVVSFVLAASSRSLICLLTWSCGFSRLSFAFCSFFFASSSSSPRFLYVSRRASAPSPSVFLVTASNLLRASTVSESNLSNASRSLIALASRGASSRLIIDVICFALSCRFAACLSVMKDIASFGAVPSLSTYPFRMKSSEDKEPERKS